MAAWEAAVEESRRFLAQHPRDKHVIGHLLSALYQLKRYEELLTESGRAIGVDPDYERFHRSRALALSRLRRWEEALPSAAEASRLAPEWRLPLLVLGLTQLLCHDYTAALETGRRYLRLQPDHEGAHHICGAALWHLGQREQAWEELHAGLRLDPTCDDLHAEVALMYLYESKTQDAIHEQLEAIRLVPAEPRHQLALCYLLRCHIDSFIGPDLNTDPQVIRGSHLAALSSLFYLLEYEKPGRRPMSTGRIDQKYPACVTVRGAVDLPDLDPEVVKCVMDLWISSVQLLGRDLLTGLEIPRDALDTLLSGKRGFDYPPLSLANFLQRWADAVTEMEEGYPRTQNAYVHDLLLRDHLDEIADRLSPADRAALYRVLGSWDERFRNATQRRHAGRQSDDSVPWWWTRRPRVAPGFEVGEG